MLTPVTLPASRSQRESVGWGIPLSSASALADHAAGPAIFRTIRAFTTSGYSIAVLGLAPAVRFNRGGNYPDTGGGPPARARFVCDDAAPADPLRDRALALLRRAAAPVSSATLRTALGVRKQTLLALLQRLAAEGLVHRAGREGWTSPAQPVPGPVSIVGNRNPPSA